MQWVGIDKVKKADGTTLEMGDALVALSTGTILDGAVTAAKLASNAITEAHTLAGTFTTASLNASAGILGSQLDAAAGIVGAQLASKTVTASKIADATITTSQISATAAITGSQLAAAAAIAGTQLASNAAIAGTQLAASANIAGTQLSSSAAIAGSQLGIGAMKLASGTIPYTATTGAITGMTIPANSLIIAVWTVCTVTFAAAAYTLTIGDGTTAAGFIPTLTLLDAGLTQTATANANVTGITPTQRGTLLYDATMKSIPMYTQAGFNVTATIAKTSATAGSLNVYCVYMTVA